MPSKLCGNALTEAEMSKWDGFTGGQLANERTQRKIDDHFEYKRQMRLIYLVYAICAVLAALVLWGAA